MKGQTEIIGLAFVVMLSVIGLLFFVVLSTNTVSTPDFREKQLASSMISAMVNTDLAEGKYEDLVRECAARLRNCDVLEEKSLQMLEIFDTYGQEYLFRVEGTDVELRSAGCHENSERKAASLQQIPLFGGAEKATIVLSLCE